MSEIKKVRKISGDHDYELTDSFSRAPRRITQTRCFKAGNVVIAIGELNRPNHWNDEAFEAACKHLQTAWNKAVDDHAKRELAAAIDVLENGRG